MSFHLYFAGAGVPKVREYWKQLGSDVLLSWFNDKSTILNWINWFKETGKVSNNIFVDSGAWTAYTKGVDIDIDAYCDFINQTGDYIAVYAEVDKIPGRFGMPVTTEQAMEAPKISWDNYIYMITHIKPEYRDKIIPVFHYGEDFKYLHQILDYTFEDGHHIQYMGLGAIADLDKPLDRYNWFDHCFKIIKNSENPNIKVHAFGMTALNILKDFPFYSADSTTWVMCSSHGTIIINDKKIVVSDRRTDNPGNIVNKSTAVQEEVQKKITQAGYTLDQLSTDYVARAMFNVKSMQDWADNFQYVPKGTITKTQLF